MARLDPSLSIWLSFILNRLSIFGVIVAVALILVALMTFTALPAIGSGIGDRLFSFATSLGLCGRRGLRPPAALGRTASCPVSLVLFIFPSELGYDFAHFFLSILIVF